MNIINGKEIAAQIYKELEQDITKLKKERDITPGLAVILVGENPASLVYVRGKKKMCEKLGVYFEEYRLMSTAQEREVLELIEKLNYNPNIHGMLIQLPLPEHINALEVQKAVSPYKDIDGFNPENVGRLVVGEARFVSCTPLGIQKLLVRSGVKISGSNVVIVGRSNIVGKPLASILMQKKENANATVTVCHSRTKNIAEYTKKADIVIVAIGKPKFLTGDMVSEGVVVIDVGINRVNDKLVGDVDFDSVSQKANYITKVPGGVGPMTIAMLMYNTVKAAQLTVGVEEK